MKEGDKVIFNDKVYIILHAYSSGYYEIKDLSSYQVELVSGEEIKSGQTSKT
ncbi:hypothetical protein [Niallia taxi]|uniref:hypothetical protein n=1 Tax=Niallia taxi TaxID=2499688 RepID=UPI0015F43888|nr:hypothetical protein [Niallia taxi]